MKALTIQQLWATAIVTTGGIMLRKILDILWVVFHPSYWIIKQDYDPVWDKRLRELLRSDDFVILNGYVALIGNFVVWVGNHPFNSFTREVALTSIPGRPSRITIRDAWEKLQEARVKMYDKPEPQ